MASVTYGICNLWQVQLMASVTSGKIIYGKCIFSKCNYRKCNYGKFCYGLMANVFMAKVLWQIQKRSKVLYQDKIDIYFNHF